jgi:alpha-glucosidase
MESNTPNPDELTSKTVELKFAEKKKRKKFHHLNNPADGIKPIVKKYLGVPNHVDRRGINFTLPMAKPKLRLLLLLTKLSA